MKRLPAFLYLNNGLQQLPTPPAKPGVLDLNLLFAIPQARSTFSPTLIPPSPLHQLPEGHLDQRTQQTSPQMPQVLRHRLQGHPLQQKNSEGLGHGFLSRRK